MYSEYLITNKTKFELHFKNLLPIYLPIPIPTWNSKRKYYICELNNWMHTTIISCYSNESKGLK